ncbi:RNA polymerase sigma factor SigB [Hazenella sp. IB182357]|uniref:RNA polymerase sigma factor SigB n=1 Tax=Polycladospora coralii TaxID=2771432 RepID=A0A926RTZ6_9BACL|nr:RNA polymerase sigma factor SigB [Polycladospora coralii]MBD1372298.1 RNA polymerase sigma factor SigB [Polycladospora coralii]MBS7531512.1 RNA polymerase sigma factor SigB [Polycladospora coralii]
MASHPQATKRTDKEIEALIRQYQEQGDQEAQEILVKHFKGLVETLAYKFARGSESHEDLTQVGMLGLLGSIKRFDLTVGKSFEGYAIPTIVGEIKRHIRDKTWSVHVPRRIKELGPRIKRAVEELTTKLQRSPQVDEIASYLEVSVEEVLETMEMGRSYNAASVDSPIEAMNDGSQVTLLDLVGNEDDGYEQIDQKMLIEKVIDVLSEREREIIQLTFFENLSQKQAGEQLQISQMHVSRLQRRALEKLRQAIRMEASEVIK